MEDKWMDKWMAIVCIASIVVIGIVLIVAMLTGNLGNL